MTHIEKLIATALSFVGYIEKASNSQLDDKTANAGHGNFTCFARDLDAIGFYNTPKQGVPWCDVSHDAWHVYTFGAENAKKLLCQPDKSCGAGCGFSANYYKAKGQFHKTNPKPGDQAFFLDSAGDVAHTGLVYKADNLYVYTIEGNTSPQAGVVGNGGGVWKKQYALTYDRIYGYGRPDYAGILGEETNEPTTATTKKGDFTMEMRVLKNGCSGSDVRALQILLIGNGWDGGTWGADGNFGQQTEAAVTAYQKKHGLQVDGKAGPETMSSLLGVS